MTGPEPSWKVLYRAYRFAAVMCVATFIPGCDLVLYSGHGGVGWFILPFVFPVALFVMYRALRKTAPESAPSIRRASLISISLYPPVSLGAAYVVGESLHRTFGYNTPMWLLWGLLMSPFGLPFVWFY
jgi:hypothetical protein